MDHAAGRWCIVAMVQHSNGRVSLWISISISGLEMALVVLPVCGHRGTSGFSVAHKVEASGASDCGFLDGCIFGGATIRSTTSPWILWDGRHNVVLQLWVFR